MFTWKFCIFLSALCAPVLAQNATICDAFHNSMRTRRGRLSSLFVGKNGVLLTQIGITEAEQKAGPIELTIDNCDGSCEITSRSPSLEFEGSQDNKYKIKLTDTGLERIQKPRGPAFSGRRVVPVANHIRLPLIIRSGTVDGEPKIPKITKISFGEVYECQPNARRARVLGPICRLVSQCPTTLTTPLEAANQFTMTLNEGNRRFIRLEVQLAEDASALHLLKINDKRARIKSRPGKCSYVFFIRRGWWAARMKKPIQLTFHVAREGSIDTSPVSYVSTKPLNRRINKCGFTCGVKVPCPKPIITTVAPPQPTTAAPSPPEPTTTEAPEPTTDAPEPTTDAPEPTTDAPEPTTDAPEPTTDAPEPTTDAPEPTTDAPEPATDAPEPTTDAPEPTTDAPEPTTDAPEPTTDAPEPTTEAPEPPTEEPEEPEEPEGPPGSEDGGPTIGPAPPGSSLRRDVMDDDDFDRELLEDMW